MISISLCMIVKDEEEVLARCLDSVEGIADEIVIVDTGSKDHTKQIAARYTERIFDFDWIDDFSAARNFSFSKAQMDYCLWLDADDVILEQDRAALLTLKQTLQPDTDVVMMRYHTAFDKDGRPIFSYYRERLLRREAGFLWQGQIHEAIAPAGRMLYSEIAVTHRKIRPTAPDRNLNIFKKILSQGGILDPRQQFYYARELYYHNRFPEAVQVLEELWSSGQGWLENRLESCRLLAKCRDAMGEQEKAVEALLRSLELDLPRAEICCDLGASFLRRELYPQAVFWYELALTRNRDDKSGAFVEPDCYGYLPFIQLCVCWDKMGDREKAKEYNDRAGSLKPEDAAYLYNKRYFESLA